MMTREQVDCFLARLDAVVYNETAIVKILTPFYMTAAQRCQINILRRVVHVDKAWFLMIFTKSTDIEQVRTFLMSVCDLLDDVVIL